VAQCTGSISSSITAVSATASDEAAKQQLPSASTTVASAPAFAAFCIIVFMVECVEIKIRHQVGLYIVNRFTQRLNEFVEIFFVQEDLVPVITIVIKAFAAFSNGQEIIVTPGSPYIKKIGSSFTGPDPFTVNTFHFFVVVLVRHSC
jgi:hypothetical protein